MRLTLKRRSDRRRGTFLNRSKAFGIYDHKGFKDILPGEVEVWQRVERRSRRVFRNFGFLEIKLPLMEMTELFKRSIGEETDIVSKEMYTFTDSKGRNFSLRPEATASLVRAYIQHRLYQDNPSKRSL